MTREELRKLSRENLRNSKQNSLCECYDEAFIKGYELSIKRIAELEKENAELKEQCLILADCTTCNSTCKTENIEMKKQLTKAKELLTRFIMASVYFNGKETDLVEEAEQFIKEMKND